MFKQGLVDAVATRADVRQGDAFRTVDAVFEVITEALKNGDEVKVIGFGTFLAVDRAGMQGRNPRTGESVTIAASKQAKFKAGKRLRAELNQQPE